VSTSDYLVKVSDQISKLISGNEKNKNIFCEHISKVIKEAEKHGQYLRAEWQKAREAGLTQYDENKGKGKWSWWTAYSNDAFAPGGCVYFAESIGIQFYIEGKPKSDPLAYLSSMLWGSVGQVYEGLTLLDYQFVLLAIIHDAQNWQAGRERIYFNRLEGRTLADRLCHTVWACLEEKFRQTRFVPQDVQQTLEIALQAANAALPQEKPAETGQKAISGKRGRVGAWFWTVYEKTLKVVVHAVLDWFASRL
jgi:hypothetical protein